MSDPKTPAEILKALGEPFPRAAIKKRAGGGGKMYDYVETHSVINRLNAATNGEWSFHVRNVEWRADTLIAHGELTIPGLGTRTGFGVQKVAANSGEDLVKGASSDALKKAATLFGVALDLYGPDYEDMPQPAPRAPQRPADAPKAANTSADLQTLKRRLEGLKADPHPGLMTWQEAVAQTEAEIAALQGNPGARQRVMARLHAVAADAGFTHDHLHALIGAKGFPSLNDAPDDVLIALGKQIVDAPEPLRTWLNRRAADQVALMPTPEEVPNPDRYTR